MDATEEGERVTDGELVVQRQLLPSGKNTDGEYILGLRINKLELHTLVHCSTLLTKESKVFICLVTWQRNVGVAEANMKSFEKVAS